MENFKSCMEIEIKDDKAMVGGFGLMDGRSVMFIGQQKELIRR